LCCDVTVKNLTSARYQCLGSYFVCDKNEIESLLLLKYV